MLLVRGLASVTVVISLFAYSAVAQSNGSSESTAAIVNGKALPRAAIDQATSAQVYALEKQIYSLKRQALEQLIVEELLRQEAASRGIDVPKLRQTIGEGAAVTDAEVAEFLSSAPQEIAVADPDVRRDMARLQLLSRAKNLRFQQFVMRLRSSANVVLLLSEPPLEKVTMPVLYGPSRGPANAPVTIAEFADYQCPYCTQLAPILRELVDTTYRDRLRLVFKDFPLPNHPLGESGAVAARCAARQGRYWEYHDALFAAPKGLDLDRLTALATDMNLDLASFSACRSSDAPLKDVKADLAEGQRLGVRGTPTLVMNGKVIRGFRSRDDLMKLIDAELKSSRAGTSEDGK